MSRIHPLSPQNLAFGAYIFCATFPAFANDLEDSVVDLAAGNWTHQQTVFVGGRAVPQGALGGIECLTEAESQLTVGQYLNKFVQGVGPDQTCTFSDFRGVSGNVSIDVTCSNPQGATTEMTLNYEYTRQNVSVLAEGMMTAGAISTPVRVVASSQHLGAC